MAGNKNSGRPALHKPPTWTVTTRLTKEQIVKLRKAAGRENRSVSNYLSMLIDRTLTETKTSETEKEITL